MSENVTLEPIYLEDMKNSKVKKNAKDRASRRRGAREKLSTVEMMGRIAVGRDGIERFFKIKDLIAKGDYPNCKQMMRMFDVSLRTLRRDIQFMRDRGWPIKFDPQRNGFYFSEPIEGQMVRMTEAEIFALFIAQKATEQYAGTALYAPLQTAFSKLTMRLDNREKYTMQDLDAALSFRPFAPEIMDHERFKKLNEAIHQRRAVKFTYKKPGEKKAELRQVDPYVLTCADNTWYVIGYDDERKDFRTFALGRIQGSIEVGEKYEQVEFDVNEYLGKSLNMMKGDGDYEIVLQFDPWSTDIIRTRHWHGSAQITELPGGGSQMRMRLSALEEVERWVMSWGTHVTVMKPGILARRVATIAGDLAKRYAVEVEPQSCP